MSYLDMLYWKISDEDAEHVDKVFVALGEAVSKDMIARVLHASAAELAAS